MNNLPLLGPTGTLFLLLYLSSLVLVGLAGRRARKEDSLADFYLGGRGMGVFVLFLTLYATQYSGNTLVGYAGSAYRSGFGFLVSVPFMMGIIAAYLVFAPRLFALSRTRGYITLGDWLQDRYGSRPLTVLASCLAIFALGNYILSNLKAIGYIVEAATGGRVSFTTGIVLLSLIMVVYETLGGLRSVAWTDAIQGILLLAGCVVIFGAIEWHYGGLSSATANLATTNPRLLAPPDGAGLRAWLSTLAIIFFGVAVYPQAIQRIYAAKSAVTLRRSLQVMVFMPLVTTFFIFLVGIVGAARFPGLDRTGSESVALLLLGDLVHNVPGVAWMVVLFIAAVIAAIMSTVDSALLALSSVFTKDIYAPRHPEASQHTLTWVGKAFSWGAMAVTALLANILPQTIWRLTEIKLEVLCQIAPALFLGINLPGLSKRAVFAGLIAGTATTMALMLTNILGADVSTKPLGIHAGLWGLAANVATICIVTISSRRS